MHCFYIPAATAILAVATQAGNDFKVVIITNLGQRQKSA